MSAPEVLFHPCDIWCRLLPRTRSPRQTPIAWTAKFFAKEQTDATTSHADSVIENKGIFIVPDILGNAGGVTVSYFEWVQDRQGFFWRESEVNDRLQDVIDHSFEQVVRYAETHGVNNRIAAYIVAIDRVARALRLRGIYA